MRRRKFCLCRPRPARASTAICSCSSVNSGGISSNTTGRYLILARRRAMPVARMRRWSCRIDCPATGRPEASGWRDSGTSPASNSSS
ncbi:Uncharacterised protein [Bordetella pertussis]|nr:Uncharacterised protein [Bordetella pertussis]